MKFVALCLVLALMSAAARATAVDEPSHRVPLSALGVPDVAKAGGWLKIRGLSVPLFFFYSEQVPYPPCEEVTDPSTKCVEGLVPPPPR